MAETKATEATVTCSRFAHLTVRCLGQKRPETYIIRYLPAVVSITSLLSGLVTMSCYIVLLQDSVLVPFYARIQASGLTGYLDISAIQSSFQSSQSFGAFSVSGLCLSAISPSDRLYVNRYFNFGGLLQNQLRIDKQTEATIYLSSNSAPEFEDAVNLRKHDSDLSEMFRQV